IFIALAWLAKNPDESDDSPAAPPEMKKWRAVMDANAAAGRAKLLREKPPLRTRARARPPRTAIIGTPTAGEALCVLHDGPPCTPLYTDLPAVLLDRARWPTAICRSTLER